MRRVVEKTGLISAGDVQAVEVATRAMKTPEGDAESDGAKLKRNLVDRDCSACVSKRLYAGGGELLRPLATLSPCEAVQAFCELLGDELDDREAHGLSAEDLRRYYQNLFLADGVLSPLGVCGYANRLAPALSCLQGRSSAVKLLDAGCGYGTESLLFALAGADVTGVELVPERAHVARSRVGFYRERAPGGVSIQFIHSDAIRYLREERAFDIIWIMEATSHIHPLETFLSLAHERLSPGGLLITSDPNALNPVALYRACRIRGAPRYTLRIKALDPDSGAPVYEAVERLLSVVDYARRLSKIGFEVAGVSMSGFMASSLVPGPLHRNRLVFTLLTSLQRTLQTIPGLRLLGTIYTIVARKTAGDEARGRRDHLNTCRS